MRSFGRTSGLPDGHRVVRASRTGDEPGVGQVEPVAEVGDGGGHVEPRMREESVTTPLVPARLSSTTATGIVAVADHEQGAALQEQAVAVVSSVAAEVDVVASPALGIDPVQQAGGCVHDDQGVAVRRTSDAVQIEAGPGARVAGERESGPRRSGRAGSRAGPRGTS